MDTRPTPPTKLLQSSSRTRIPTTGICPQTPEPALFVLCVKKMDFIHSPFLKEAGLISKSSEE